MPFSDRRPVPDGAEARGNPAVQEIHRAFRADPGMGRMAPHTSAMLVDACVMAGVELGAFDRRVLAWLSGLGTGDSSGDRRADHPRACCRAGPAQYLSRCGAHRRKPGAGVSPWPRSEHTPPGHRHDKAFVREAPQRPVMVVKI